MYLDFEIDFLRVTDQDTPSVPDALYCFNQSAQIQGPHAHMLQPNNSLVFPAQEIGPRHKPG